MNRHDLSTHRQFLFLAAACLLMGSSVSCTTLGGGKPTQSDRLMAAYPSLKGGRFALIADFEEPAHMQLVQLVGVSADADCSYSKKKGRKATGKGCMVFTAASPDDTVVINNDHATDWYFKRDWRPYDLLLMSVHVPRPDLQIDLSIAADSPDGRLGVRSLVPVDRGWNTLRIDLAEVAEHIPLDDIQEIRLAVDGAHSATVVAVDDILLTASRETLYGDPENTDGALYVQRVGRRWRIGAGGRFELTFANGQIVAWHNTAADPYRQQNLVQGTILGPSPVVVEPVNQPSSDFSALGNMVVAKPQILEMNPVRIVVGTEWRFVDAPDQPVDDRPFQQWVYTIYRTGQVCVTTTCTAATGAWSAEELGLAVTVASDGSDRIQTHAARLAGNNDTQIMPAHGSAHLASSGAYLLYVLDERDLSSRMIVQMDQERRRASFVALGKSDDTEIRQWRCQLLVASDGDVSDTDAGQRAMDFVSPSVERVEIGTLLDTQNTLEAGAFFGDACRVRPDRGRVRFVIDGSAQPRFSPAFEIVGANNREAWVYVNNLVFEDAVYNSQGSLVFQLPDVIRDRTTVEVFLREPTVAAGS